MISISGGLNRYRFSHASATIDERLFVFGGSSNICYTDYELYVLEMGKKHLFYEFISFLYLLKDQAFARRKRNNPIRDYLAK